MVELTGKSVFLQYLFWGGGTWISVANYGNPWIRFGSISLISHHPYGGAWGKSQRLHCIPSWPHMFPFKQFKYNSLQYNVNTSSCCQQFWHFVWKQRCSCMTRLGLTDPWHTAVCQWQFIQREGWEAQGRCSHSPTSRILPVIHTDSSTVTLMEATQASPTAPKYKALCVKRCNVFFHSSGILFLRRQCSRNTFPCHPSLC